MLFHDQKFAFFDFEVRGAPKILKIFLGVSLKRPAPGAAARRGRIHFALADKTPTFFKFLGGTPRKFPKFWGYP